jgi:hypothetical protein
VFLDERLPLSLNTKRLCLVVYCTFSALDIVSNMINGDGSCSKVIYWINKRL